MKNPRYARWTSPDGIVCGESMIGKRYGEWLVLCELDRLTITIQTTGEVCKKRRFLARCICGKECSVDMQALRNGVTSSCGCKKAEKISKRFTTHGKSNLPEHYIWMQMRKRCDDLSNKNYGAKGITYCKRWNSFENFYRDMGPRPSKDYSLDRFPNKRGNYTPNNCRWATQKQQNNNKVNNVMLDFFGETLNMKQVSERLGIKYNTLIVRLKNGWSMEKIRDTPVGSLNNKK